MKHHWFTVLLFLTLFPSALWAQRNQRRDEEFITAAPKVGDALPAHLVRTPTGGEFDTGRLRGHFTVIVFGCLT